MSDQDQPAAAPPDVPVLRVVKGEPTEEELAAVIMVLLAHRDRPIPAPPPAPSSWAAYWRSLRTAPPPGPSAWRQSARS